MERIIIQRQVCIEPKYMDMNIMDHIMNELKKNCLKECNDVYGYIMKINRIIKIIDNYINMDSNIVFNLKFEALCLNPKTDKIFTGEVCMQYTDGIFIDVMQTMKILIPKKNIVGYVFNKSTNSFVNPNNNNDKIVNKNKLKVKITASRYNNKRFDVFGNIVNE